MFAPATQTVNAQSVTFGSIFKFYLGLTNRMSFLLLKFNIQNSMFKVVGTLSTFRKFTPVVVNLLALGKKKNKFFLFALVFFFFFYLYDFVDLLV